MLTHLFTHMSNFKLSFLATHGSARVTKKDKEMTRTSFSTSVHTSGRVCGEFNSLWFEATIVSQSNSTERSFKSFFLNYVPWPRPQWEDNIKQKLSTRPVHLYSFKACWGFDFKWIYIKIHPSSPLKERTKLVSKLWNFETQISNLSKGSLSGRIEHEKCWGHSFFKASLQLWF